MDPHFETDVISSTQICVGRFHPREALLGELSAVFHGSSPPKGYPITPPMGAKNGLFVVREPQEVSISDVFLIFSAQC